MFAPRTEFGLLFSRRFRYHLGFGVEAVMVRVKVCGITQPHQVDPLVDAGVNALGLVFYPPSPRAVTPDQAVQIQRAVGPYVSTIGLFVNTPIDEVNAIADAVGLDWIQFHGSETVAQCMGAKRPWYKALRVRADDDVDAITRPWRAASNGVLLDAFVKGVPGGTGTRFNWDQVPSTRDWKLILAGGLDASNVRAAIAQTQPYAVDVSGGVESAPGIKDIQQVQAFMQEVRNDQHPNS